MALKITTGLANAYLDSGLQTQYDSGVLEIRSGTRPATPDLAPTGTVLATISLPADAFAAAASAAIAKAGTWEDAAADAAGTASWFRFRTSTDGGLTDDTEKRIDGDVTATSGGGDLELDNTNIAAGQKVTVTSFSFNQPKA